MSELISGKEAFLSHMDGKEVQWRDGELDGDWMDWHETTSWSSEALNNPTYQFRLKPRQIMIGNLEVPACGSDYKFGEPMYVLNSMDTNEYSMIILDEQDEVPPYWWHTEAEIKQVVAALKKLRKGE